VLSMMIAQRFHPRTITAVEIEPSAALDAAYNFSQASFDTIIELIQQDVRYWKSPQLFDGIITNPPYFEQSSKSDSHQRNLARHTDDLSFADLMAASARLLAPEGNVWVIVPTAALPGLNRAGEQNGLYLQEIIHIHGKPETPVRVVAHFRKEPTTLKESVFTIRNTDGSYTAAYIELTKEFHAVDLSLAGHKQ
jgi:tRNA1Val (adenine37-N6)-methyltransferase